MVENTLTYYSNHQTTKKNNGVQLAGKVNDKTRDILLSCRRKSSQKRFGTEAKLETE